MRACWIRNFTYVKRKSDEREVINTEQLFLLIFSHAIRYQKVKYFICYAELHIPLVCRADSLVKFDLKGINLVSNKYNLPFGRVKKVKKKSYF